MVLRNYGDPKGALNGASHEPEMDWKMLPLVISEKTGQFMSRNDTTVWRTWSPFLEMTRTRNQPGKLSQAAAACQNS